MGCLFAGLGFLYAIYTVIKKLVNPAVPVGFSALMTAVMVIGGMLMVMLGLVGEYVGRTYISVNRAPQYVVRDRVGNPETFTANEEIRSLPERNGRAQAGGKQSMRDAFDDDSVDEVQDVFSLIC